MVRSEKVHFVTQLTERLGQSRSVIMADFKGLTVAQINDLRRQLGAQNVEFKVIKNRLGKIALKDAGCDSLDEILIGNTAWAFGVQDAVEPAKILSKFAEDNPNLVLKGGLLGTRRLDTATVQELAKLPNRQELLTKMAIGMKQPATKMATAMTASITKVAYAFQALAEKREKEAA